MISFFLFLKFISNSLNLIPSPVIKSAIPWSEAKDNLLNIEDALAMGPAVSILLDGYVDKGKVVSLRGTLVPATKLNSIIASIPVVGDILVGKKTGEGVFGVSFKIKGHPKNLKTTVNPIKTLTPRFITRTVEKLKRKN